MKRRTLARIGILAVLALAPALAENRYILRADPAAVGELARRHGLAILRSMDDPSQGLHLVSVPDGPSHQQIVRSIKADRDVENLEPDHVVALPEISSAFRMNQSTAAILDALSNRTVVSYYGTLAWGGYTSQPAAAIIRIADAQRAFATGAGTVAFLDTGVDFHHPVLANSLTWGYDFTRNVPGGSELIDLAQSTAAILDQSTASILDKNSVAVLNQSTAAILDQSTAAILDRKQLPAAFGHGTMVAGLIHLVAPTARLMPVKVFKGDGASSLFDILRGVYFAVDRGARVINMSFSTSEFSVELMRAISYANSRGVICVASAGNDGRETLVYPAGLGKVIGVASTNNSDLRSIFSNYGDALATVAAPGEGVVSLYPGKNYAAGWGTSFSAPLVAGGAALLVQIGDHTNQAQATQALSQVVPIGQGLGAGRIDLYQACRYRAERANH